MYPDGPTRNEFMVSGKDHLDALATALHHFRNEDWRTQGTYFEVREHREDQQEKILRVVLSSE
jgi:hypothetical protein